jgi:alanine racemase
VVDAEAVPDVRFEDEVVALGRQGNEHTSAEQVAGWPETINYEVTTSLLPRVPRVYLRAGGVVEVLAPLAS